MWVEPREWGQCPHTRGPPGVLSPLSACGHSREVDPGVPTRHRTGQRLGLEVAASSVRSKCLVFHHPVCGIFVTATPVD